MRFPIDIIPEKDFTLSPLKFGARRDNGLRLHAGVDLYCPEKTPVYSIEDCIVWNSYNTFYLETGAVETRGKFTMRYAEITPTVKSGSKVKCGDLIGHVKKCKGLDQAMLHFELFEMTGSSLPLTNKNNSPYKRRNDLLDPTKFLLDLMSQHKFKA